MPNEHIQVRERPRLRSESEHWVEASLARKSRFNWRELVLQGLHYSGALKLARRISRSHEILPGTKLPLVRFRRAPHPKFVILCYHGIGEAGNPLGFAPTPETFEEQMRFLRRHYRVVSLDEVYRELREPRTTEPGIAITFDDGYRNAYTTAFPILKKYSLPATIFVTLECIETGQVAWYDRVFLAMGMAPRGELHVDLENSCRFQLNSPEDRLRAALEVVAFLRTLPNSRREECSAALEKCVGLPHMALAKKMLTWEQIREMYEGGVAFGSHTLSHPVVSQLNSEELERELAESKRLLEERLGSPVLDFAFPFGKASDCSPQAIAQLSRSGYRSAVTTIPGVNTPCVNPFELRRVQIGHDASLARFAFDLNQAFLQGTDSAGAVSFSPTPIRELQDHVQQSTGRAVGGRHA